MYDLVPNSPFYVNLWNQFYELGWLPIETNTTFSVGGYYSVRGKERKGREGREATKEQREADEKKGRNELKAGQAKEE